MPILKFCPSCNLDLSKLKSAYSNGKEVSPAPPPKASDYNGIEDDIESQIIRKVILKKKPTKKQSEHLTKAREVAKANREKKKAAKVDKQPENVQEEAEPQEQEEISFLF
jgi:hypothetical protein